MVIISYSNKSYRILLIKKSLFLRIDNCDERRVYKSEYIAGPKGGTYMFNTSPKSSDLIISRTKLMILKPIF